jgi:prepilin-type N-terminal cleavage/methylation domain-containing protein
MRVRNQSIKKATSHCNTGFTLLELIISLTLLGIVSAIAIPAWNGFIDRQRLNAAQYRVYQAMQEAKSNAMRDKITWEASFQQLPVAGEGVVQWSVHPASSTATATSWQNLDVNIRLDDETSLPQSKGVRRVRFNLYGCPVYQLNEECGQTSILSKGRLTLSSKHGGKAKRCVIVSTLLGALRTAKENPKKQDSKYYCY